MKTPRIGQHWPEQNGIYAGIARGFDGEPDGHIVLLDDRPPEEEMNWFDAMAWATGLGCGTRLPNKFEMSLICINIRDEISQEGLYWTSTECTATGAFYQNLYSSDTSFQDVSNKQNAFYARAVRRLVI